MSISPEDLALAFCTQEFSKPNADNTMDLDWLEKTFFEAAENNWLEVIKLFLSNGADIDGTCDRGSEDRDKGWTALTLAASRGHSEAVELLLKHNAEINKPKRNGATALFLAAQEGHTEVVRLLLAHDASVDKVCAGATPLLQACSANHTETAKLLIDNHANTNYMSPIKRGTPLMQAAFYGNVTLMEHLLRHSAKIDMQTPSGDNALLHAVNNSHIKAVQFLIDQGADANTIHPVIGITALSHAMKRGDMAIIETLLRSKELDVNAEIFQGHTALELAIAGEKFDIVGLLLKRKEIQLKMRKGTALILNLENGASAISSTLQHPSWVNVLYIFWESPTQAEVLAKLFEQLKGARFLKIELLHDSNTIPSEIVEQCDAVNTHNRITKAILDCVAGFWGMQFTEMGLKAIDAGNTALVAPALNAMQSPAVSKEAQEAMEAIGIWVIVERVREALKDPYSKIPELECYNELKFRLLVTKETIIETLYGYIRDYSCSLGNDEKQPAVRVHVAPDAPKKAKWCGIL